MRFADLTISNTSLRLSSTFLLDAFLLLVDGSGDGGSGDCGFCCSDCCSGSSVARRSSRFACNFKHFFFKVPSSEAHWKEKAHEWNELWNFPHCVGAIDGKHVVIEAPSNSNSDYYNYKDQFSIVLLAIVDASYNVIYANCGAKGRASDSGIFQETSFYQRMVEHRLNFPNQETISPDGPDLPYVILGDSAFPLSENLMRPYPGIHNRGTMKRIFNYRLCRARRVVENVFGILCVVFRVFRKPIPLKPENCELIVMACLYMHNFLRRNKQSRALYTPPMTFDFEDSDHNVIEGAWRREYTVEGTSILELERRPRNSARTATIIRDQFGEYFMSERGSLPWQNNVA